MIFSLITAASIAAIVFSLWTWFGSDDWHLYPVTFWALALVFFGRVAVSQLRWWVLPFMKRPLPMKAAAGLKVAAVTTFVPASESIEMLDETVASLTAMEYPHDTWVLDEGDSEQVKALCERHGAFHFSRRDMPEYQTADGTFAARTKHGNYNSWLYEKGFDAYEFIASFDPDHIPKRIFLTQALGYFDDHSIGYVQSAQAYYNQQASFIARGAAEETYSYYSATQMYCYAMGYPIVTGCHTTHRAAALKAVGGFASHDADDLLITLLYRSQGWRGVYVPKILARGLVPVDWEGYLSQQLRWARSVLDIKFWIHPAIAGKLSFREITASFFHGFYYLQGATTLVILLAAAYMLASGTTPQAVNYFVSPSFAFLTGSLLLCDLFRQRFYLDRPSEWGLHWRAGILQLAKWPYLVLALVQVVLRRRTPYNITRKSEISAESNIYRLFFPQILAAMLIIAAWLFGTHSGYAHHPLINVFALAIVCSTVLLISSIFLSFPPSYSKSLKPPPDS